MINLSRYDEWKTREPDEGRGEDLQWFAEVINPHDARQQNLGPFDSENEAIIASEEWLLNHTMADNSKFRDSYYCERIYSVDLNEGCICPRFRRSCPIHGIDPDAAYDARFE